MSISTKADAPIPGTLLFVGVPGIVVAVALGFEPRVAMNHTDFRDLHLRPLGHATSPTRLHGWWPTPQRGILRYQSRPTPGLSGGQRRSRSGGPGTPGRAGRRATAGLRRARRLARLGRPGRSAATGLLGKQGHTYHRFIRCAGARVEGRSVMHRGTSFPDTSCRRDERPVFGHFHPMPLAAKRFARKMAIL